MTGSRDGLLFKDMILEFLWEQVVFEVDFQPSSTKFWKIQVTEA